MAGRMFARIGLMHQTGLDDYLLLVGWASAFVNCVLACLGTVYGEGMHQRDIKEEWIVPALKLNYATLVCYQASFAFTKLAICVFYDRVFGTMKGAKWQIYAIGGFVIAYTIPLELVSILSCVPPQKVWDPTFEGGYCLNTIIAFWTSFACNLISDIWIIIFAIPKVWSLKMQTRQKVILLSVLTTSWIVVIAGIVRVARISAVIHSDDTTWRSYDSSIWSAVEINVCVICAAAPAWKAIFKRYMPNFMYSLSGKTSETPKAAYGDQSSRSRPNGKGGVKSGVFEMSRSLHRSALTSPSQEELANSSGRNEWVMGKADINAESDMVSEGSDKASDKIPADHEGIMKSTQVTVDSWSGSQPGPSTAV